MSLFDKVPFLKNTEILSLKKVSDSYRDKLPKRAVDNVYINSIVNYLKIKSEILGKGHLLNKAEQMAYVIAIINLNYFLTNIKNNIILKEDSALEKLVTKITNKKQ